MIQRMFQKSQIVVLLVSVILGLQSCKNNVVYKEYKKTENLEWLKSDAKTFTFENTDDSTNVDVIFAFRYAQGFQFNAMLVNFAEHTPIGNFSYPLSIKIRDEKGAYIGDGSGDIWDIQIPVKQGVKLAKGTYTFIATPAMPVQKTHMVMEVGCIIKKSK